MNLGSTNRQLFASFILLEIIFGLNSSAFGREIIAFHGLNQSIRSGEKPGPNECTASMVNHETHHYIENTVESIGAAFKLGATIGHFNIRKTLDDRLVAFHDEDLSCRTDGIGNLSTSLLSYLRSLDVGYGYTPDDGKTFPTRGLGVGKIPTLTEILNSFPGKTFVINDKIGDDATARILAKVLGEYPEDVKKNLIYIGNGNSYIKTLIPEMKVVATKSEHLRCLNALKENQQDINNNCSHLNLAIPMDLIRADLPHLPQMITQLHSVNAKIWIWDVNTPEDAKLLKKMNLDAIGTYRIDKTIDELSSLRVL